MYSFRTFLPAYAEDELGLSASGLGLLTSFLTAGGLCGSLVVVWLGDTPHKGRFLLVSGLVAGLVLLLLAGLSFLAAALVLVFLLGAAGSLIRVINMTVLQSHCDPDYRGRINSLLRTTRGVLPLWLLPAGAIADRKGVSLVLGLQGVLALAAFAAVMVFKPEVRELD